MELKVCTLPKSQAVIGTAWHDKWERQSGLEGAKCQYWTEKVSGTSQPSGRCRAKFREAEWGKICECGTAQLRLEHFEMWCEKYGENVMPKWVHVKVTPDWPPLISFSILKIWLNMLYYVLIIVSIEKARWRNTVYCCKFFTKIENLFWIRWISTTDCSTVV